MGRIRIVTGDITREQADAIVNAANERMLGGGGVDGAIHRAAGPELLEACRRVPEVSPGVRCPVGEARVTPAFGLRARMIIHTVGPIWQGGDSGEAELLGSAYGSSLELAAAEGARSVAFPGISTGVFGYPRELAAAVAREKIEAFLAGQAAFEQVTLVAFVEDDARVLRRAFDARA